MWSLDRAGEGGISISVAEGIQRLRDGRSLMIVRRSTPRDNTIALALISIADSLAKLANGRESERGI